MDVVAVVVALVLGAGAGFLVQRVADRFVPSRGMPPGAGMDPGTELGIDEDAADARATAISVRVPPAVTVGATALLCGLAGLRFGASWVLPAYLVLAVAGVLLSVIDLEHRLLPNRVLLPSTIVVAALFGVAAAAAAAEGGWSHLRNAVLGAAILFVLFLALALVAPSGLGMGDVKLAGLLGLPLGWLGMGALAVGAVAGFVVQAVLAMALLLTRRIGRKAEIPFGPALFAGAVVALGWSSAIISVWTAGPR